MARLQTVLLPNGGFTYILDEYTTPVVEGCESEQVWAAELESWSQFAIGAGARGIMITANSVEIVNPFENDFDDDEDDDDQARHDTAHVVPIRLRTPSEAERRLLAAIFGECDCATDAKHPPTDDEPATDNPQSGDDGTPAETGTARQPCGCMPSADLARAAFDPADHPTPEELTEREKRVEKILAASGTVQRLDESGAPVGEPIPCGPITVTTVPCPDGCGAPLVIASHVAPPLDIDTSPEPVAQTDPLFGNVAVPVTKGEGGPQIGTMTVDEYGAATAKIGDPIEAVRIVGVPLSGDWAPVGNRSPLLCPAENSQGLGCSLPTKHEGLHEFAMMRAMPEA